MDGPVFGESVNKEKEISFSIGIPKVSISPGIFAFSPTRSIAYFQAYTSNM